MKIYLFLIVSLIVTNSFDNSVLAINNQIKDPSIKDETSSVATRCVYRATEYNEEFTITYSVSPNNKGGAQINWIENTHSQVKLKNSYVYGKEFITEGEKITCPQYLTYELHRPFYGDSTIKVGFRPSLKYSKKMELVDSTNNNRKFSSETASIINTCSYDNSVDGRLYIEAYTDGTLKTSISNQDYDEYKFYIHLDSSVTSDLFTTTSCPSLATGSGYNHDKEKFAIYVMKYNNDFELTYKVENALGNTQDIVVPVDMEFKTGSMLKTTGDDILASTEDSEVDFGDQVDVNCEGIIGEELLDFINKIFRWIRIIAPIFVIIMGSVEFAGAILQDDKDALKKASNKFMKRLIIAVALFFVPLIMEFLLNIFNEFSRHSTEICGIGE